MKNNLKVEVSFYTLKDDVVVIDGGGMLHSSVYWLKEGSLEDLVNRAEYYSLKFINVADVYLYLIVISKQLKSDTQLERTGTYNRIHKLAIRTPLAPKESCISSTTAKENLI